MRIQSFSTKAQRKTKKTNKLLLFLFLPNILFIIFNHNCIYLQHKQTMLCSPKLQLLMLKSSFLHRIKRGIQYSNPQRETVQITGFLGKACYLFKIQRSLPNASSSSSINSISASEHRGIHIQIKNKLRKAVKKILEDMSPKEEGRPTPSTIFKQI